MAICEAQDDALEAAWQAHLERWQQKLDAAQRLADAGKPLRFKDPLSPNLTYLISPELRDDAKPGTWRVTTFTRGEPYGHMEFDTAFEAFKEATTHDWEVLQRKPMSETEEDGPRRIQDLSDYFRDINAQEDLEAGDEPFDPQAPDAAHHRYVRENYLFGECAAFAVALHRLTGWPLYEIKAPNRYHVFLQDPKGRLVDASGYTTLAKIRRVHRLPSGTVPQAVPASALVDDLDDDSLSDPWHHVRMAEFYIRQLPMPPFNHLAKAGTT
jgi:hypothetical protein